MQGGTFTVAAGSTWSGPPGQARVLCQEEEEEEEERGLHYPSLHLISETHHTFFWPVISSMGAAAPAEGTHPCWKLRRLAGKWRISSSCFKPSSKYVPAVLPWAVGLQKTAGQTCTCGSLLRWMRSTHVQLACRGLFNLHSFTLGWSVDIHTRAPLNLQWHFDLSNPRRQQMKWWDALGALRLHEHHELDLGVYLCLFESSETGSKMQQRNERVSVFKELARFSQLNTVESEKCVRTKSPRGRFPTCIPPLVYGRTSCWKALNVSAGDNKDTDKAANRRCQRWKQNKGRARSRVYDSNQI